MSITIKQELVGPDRAAALLRGNKMNRRLRPRLVERYADDIANDRWMDSGDPIRIDVHGTLLDGQHRLHAVIEAGKAIPMVVIEGVQTQAMLTMDTGARRSFADHLRITGHKNTSALAAVARWCVLYERGDIRGKGAASHAEMNDWLNDNPDVADIVNHVWARSSNPIGCRARLPLAVTRFYCKKAHEHDIFMSRLTTGVGIEDGDPIHVLRRFIENSMIGKRPSPIVMQAVTIKAWNAYMLGERPRVLTFRSGGSSPEPFPEIIEEAE